MKRVRKAIIPVAGFGTRFLPITKAVPKEMLPIVDIPTIEYIVKEAVELRLSGFKNKIFVLNQPYVEDIENIINYDVTIGVADLNFIKELSKRKDKFTIHLELETGMGRTGISLTDLDEVLEFLKEILSF